MALASDRSLMFMPRSRIVRSLALLVVAALCPAVALALNEKYEGVLKPDDADPPIPIVVELQDSGSTLKGSVQTAAPLQAKAPIESGGNLFGHCTMYTVLSKELTLRLDGDCGKSGFTGTYMLWDMQKRKVTRGDFRLDRKAPEPVKADSLGRTASAGSTTAACLKANSQCLAGCPRGDAGAEFVCSNRCRTKLKSCKALVKKPVIESGSSDLPPLR
jgi:hypothetical protein